MLKPMAGFFVTWSKVLGGRDRRDDTTHPHTTRDADAYDRHHPVHALSVTSLSKKPLEALAVVY